MQSIGGPASVAAATSTCAPISPATTHAGRLKQSSNGAVRPPRVRLRRLSTASQHDYREPILARPGRTALRHMLHGSGRQCAAHRRTAATLRRSMARTARPATDVLRTIFTRRRARQIANGTAQGAVVSATRSERYYKSVGFFLLAYQFICIS